VKKSAIVFGLLLVAVAALQSQELSLPRNEGFRQALQRNREPANSFGITLSAVDGIVKSETEGNVFDLELPR
jgi:hypothetical protein